MRKRQVKKIQIVPSKSKRLKPVFKKETGNVVKKTNPTWMVLAVVFCLVLFLNAFFAFSLAPPINPEGDTLGTTFYLSGPDPYYNMRLCEEMMYGENAGWYPFLLEPDPLLDYPIGRSGGRPPLFNFIAVFSAPVVSTFTGMEEWRALGYAMLFLPAIYGALLIFPVYGISKELFNRRTGWISAFLVSIIPIHLGSGHGSALSLFDHDSFILLMVALTFFFFVKMLKEKDQMKGLLYATLAAMPVIAIEMAWVGGQLIFMLLAIFMVVYLLVQLTKKEYRIDLFVRFIIMSGSAWVLVLPYVMQTGNTFEFAFLGLVVSSGVTAFYYVMKRLNLPSVVSFPVLGSVAVGGLGLLYLVSQEVIDMKHTAVASLAKITFGAGMYGTKVSGTIAEVSTFDMSRSIMSFGPALFWVAVIAFVFFSYKTIKDEFRKPENLLLMFWFVISLVFLSTAGRFLNDLVPLIAIFGGYGLYEFVKYMDLKSMFKNLNISSSDKVFTLRWYHITMIIGAILAILTPFVANVTLFVWTSLIATTGILLFVSARGFALAKV